jgi:hypothetical protein
MPKSKTTVTLSSAVILERADPRQKTGPTAKRATSRRARRRVVDPETAAVFAGALTATQPAARKTARHTTVVP